MLPTQRGGKERKNKWLQFPRDRPSAYCDWPTTNNAFRWLKEIHFKEQQKQNTNSDRRERQSLSAIFVLAMKLYFQICTFLAWVLTSVNISSRIDREHGYWLDSIAVSVFVDWLSLSNTNQKQIQITIWWRAGLSKHGAVLSYLEIARVLQLIYVSAMNIFLVPHIWGSG